MNEYDYGDVVRGSVAFTNAAGSAVDPGSVRFMWKTPAGSMGTYTYSVDAELVKDAVGCYHADITASISGVWRVRFDGIVSSLCAGESEFYCKESEFD